MRRLYEEILKFHLQSYKQMAFIAGPRQVGKTTSALKMLEIFGKGVYLNWDLPSARTTILQGADAILEAARASQLTTDSALIILDEIHKFADWKNLLKGLFDGLKHQAKIIVTGSARLDVFNRGGDSLMGRYLFYRFHPLSVGEIVEPKAPEQVLRKTPLPIDEADFQALLEFGGFPDPYLERNERFASPWRTLRFKQLCQEDMRDLTRVQEIAQMEVLIELLRYQVGKLTSFESLAKKVRVSANTIRQWIQILKGLFYCFEVKPYTKNVTRSLLKEPKYYLWDWSLCPDKGARAENFVALHLLKAVNLWSDLGLGHFDLYFLRDKEKREVDFLLTKDDLPWMLVEVKNGAERVLHPNLLYFRSMLKPDFCFQVTLESPYVDKSCFLSAEPLIVPARTFLSQLP